MRKEKKGTEKQKFSDFAYKLCSSSLSVHNKMSLIFIYKISSCILHGDILDFSLNMAWIVSSLSQGSDDNPVFNHFMSENFMIGRYPSPVC